MRLFSLSLTLSALRGVLPGRVSGRLTSRSLKLTGHEPLIHEAILNARFKEKGCSFLPPNHRFMKEHGRPQIGKSMLSHRIGPADRRTSREASISASESLYPLLRSDLEKFDFCHIFSNIYCKYVRKKAERGKL